MSIRSLFFAFVVVIFAQELVVMGPTYDIVLQKPDYMHKEMTYCHDRFVREPATQYSAEYVLFHYSKDGTIAHDEVPLKDLTVVIISEGSDKTISSGPKAQMLGNDGGQTVWQLRMTEDMHKFYGDCLKGVEVKTP